MSGAAAGESGKNSGFFDRDEFREQYSCAGFDPGAAYRPEKTVFRVWAPGAESLEVRLYADGDAGRGGAPESRIPMRGEENGLWYAEASGDCAGIYYTYAVVRSGTEKEIVDPYAKALGVNGRRGMIVDLSATDPPGFRLHPLPPPAAPQDAVIYEIHVRDLSMHPGSGMKNRGKFSAFAERGTKNAAGLSTGLDHIRSLGVTHVHLLPAFDFAGVDEASRAPDYNWGYDPLNYNAPEGSYATDPFDGAARIREFKMMVQALHEAGLRLVMDVVYNHVFDGASSNFHALLPGYFFRHRADGSFSNGSACGNETASERPMMGKFIADSVCYWAREYRVDGFRFDLMGLHDFETMNRIRAELDRIDPSIILYGEGWTAGDSPLPEERRAVKGNARYMHEHIAVFSDDMRDSVKGSALRPLEAGFVNWEAAGPEAKPGERDMAVRFSIAGAVEHPDVDPRGPGIGEGFWAREPSQVINYVSVHDNHTLRDKLAITYYGAAGGSSPDEAWLERLNRLAAAIVFFSQGIPLFQAGEEMARTKGGDENSYKSPDSVNSLDWERKGRFAGLVAYYRGLIALRRRYPAFRLRSAGEIRRCLRFPDTERGLVVCALESPAAPELPAGHGNPALPDYARFTLAFNSLLEERRIQLAGEWDLLADGETVAGEGGPLAALRGSAAVPAKSALILAQRG